MDNELFEELEGNLKQAIKLAKGEAVPSSAYFVLSSADIKAIRQGVQMSQAVFARTFQLSLDTIKGWEQGKRKPDQAATNYLRMIKADHRSVLSALAA
jgi:putative transcriptional regulator